MKTVLVAMLGTVLEGAEPRHKDFGYILAALVCGVIRTESYT